MGARRGTRCPFSEAHHRVSDEVLVVSGAGSRERGPVAAQVLCFPDYKVGPARGPIWARAAGATASHGDERHGNYPSSAGWECVSGRLWVGAAFECDRTQSGKDRGKPPHPIKGSSEKATSTGVWSSNGVQLWLPNGENGCHAWQVGHHATTTNQIEGTKKGGEGRTVATCWWAEGKIWKENAPDRQFPGYRLSIWRICGLRRRNLAERTFSVQESIYCHLSGIKC